MNCTILIPTYNVEKYIEAAINSALAQTYREHDILVCDDGSTDSTVKLVERFMQRGRPVSLLSLSHKGPANVTHQGILHAQGPIVTVLDGDDMLLPKSLELVMPSFNKARARIGFIWTRFKCSNGKSGWSGPLPPKTSLWVAMTQRGWWQASHQRFLRRDVYLKSSHQLEVDLPFPSDFALALVMGWTRCRTAHIPQETYWYRIGRPGSISRAQHGLQRTNAQHLVHRARGWK